MKAAIATALLFVAAAPAQWLKYPTPGVPRAPNGHPNLAGPAPRSPNGKPDLSGVWVVEAGYTSNIAKDLKPGELTMQPWAASLYQHRQDTASRDDPQGRCVLSGVPRENVVPYPFKFLNAGSIVVVLYEALHSYRQIYMDGRALPENPNPTWMGYSVGRWEGDTLVVQSAGFVDNNWLDNGGHPGTEALRLTEKFHRRDFGHLDLQMTVDDPKAYTKPWTVNLRFTAEPDTDLIEYVCDENEKDLQHLVGK